MSRAVLAKLGRPTEQWSRLVALLLWLTMVCTYQNIKVILEYFYWSFNIKY